MGDWVPVDKIGFWMKLCWFLWVKIFPFSCHILSLQLFIWIVEESSIDLIGSKEHSGVQIPGLFNATCVATAWTKWFPFAFMVAALECSGILAISNCFNFSTTSNNSETSFLFFMCCPEKVKKGLLLPQHGRVVSYTKGIATVSANTGYLIVGQLTSPRWNN